MTNKNIYDILNTVLRLELYTPVANFRIPQNEMSRIKINKVIGYEEKSDTATFKERLTYFVPPYSTIIGLICNILSRDEDIEDFLSVAFGLSVLCQFDCINKELIQLRNLSDNSKERTAYHPGSIAPCIVHTLTNVKVLIYIFHPNNKISDLIKHRAADPSIWRTHLHLGRSEDFAIIENIEQIKITLCKNDSPLKIVDNFYTWFPSPEYFWFKDKQVLKDYELFYKDNFNSTLVPALYKKAEITTILSGKKDKKDIKNKEIIRSFNFIPAKCGKIKLKLTILDEMPCFLFDKTQNIAVFPAYISF